MENLREYLAAHDKREIKNGKSGSEVWEVEGGYILKRVEREKLSGPEAFSLYQNEARIYEFFGEASRETLPCLPRVLKMEVSDKEILILMEKYQELCKEEIDDELLQKIMRALAMIHVREIPAFLRREQKQPEILGKEQIESCLEGWRSVLAEHPGAFDERKLTEAADAINEIICWHHEEARVLVHGDFHRENLLLRASGDIVVCDWQSVGEGGASGDISFFLSRLGADGVEAEPEKAVKLYCQERGSLTGEQISQRDLLRHGKAANLITSFRFWHYYLHGCSRKNVGEIYEKMTTM